MTKRNGQSTTEKRTRCRPPAALLLATALAVATRGLALGQSTPDEAAVIGAVEDFFAAMYARDADAMRSALRPETRFALLRPGPGGALTIQGYSGEEFVALITDPATPTLRELMRDPVVHVAGDLASVWTPYQVHIDGALSHCGVDALQLMRFDGAWTIVHLADNVPTQACGEAWAVPAG